MKVNETVSNVVIQKKVSQPEPLVGGAGGADGSGGAGAAARGEVMLIKGLNMHLFLPSVPTVSWRFLVCDRVDLSSLRSSSSGY